MVRDFWARVDVQDDCWLWTGSTTRGYGQIRSGGRVVYAHRFALEQALGRKLAAHELACHTCDNPACVNPAHLWPGTHRDNAADSVRKGRHPEAAQTHCKRGHPFAGDNLRIVRGKRRCLACHRAISRASYHRRRA